MSCAKFPQPTSALYGICNRPLLLPHPRPKVGSEKALEFITEVSPIFLASPQQLDMAALVDAGEPKLLRGGVWPQAVGWTWNDMDATLQGETMSGVLLTDDVDYAPTDDRSPLGQLLKPPASANTSVRNVSAEWIIGNLRDASERSGTTGARHHFDGRRHLRWFGDVPEPLRIALQPSRALYHSEFDHKAAMQYMWLSSSGSRTHTHFDNDHNVFVQLIGTKRFVLWPPNQSEALCPYPRLHPLWHKSRAHFGAPDMRVPACANYSRARALALDVQPGDLLYLPPWWWHTVETRSPSLSLSTLSRWPELYNHLNALYTHKYLFDDLRRHDARIYALRAFLVQLMRKAGAPRLIERILTQYSGLESVFELSETAATKVAPSALKPRDDNGRVGNVNGNNGAGTGVGSGRCSIDHRGTPMCRWCLSRVNFDVSIVWEEHLAMLPEAVRAIALAELVEELTAETLGAAEVLPFWRECLGQSSPPFFLTKAGSAEHEALWMLA